MNTDWTVSSRRFVPLKWKAPTSKVEERLTAENKVNEDDETLKPGRRNVVSRINRSSDQDAQFIFRLPTHQNIPYVLLLCHCYHRQILNTSDCKKVFE